MNQLPAIGKSRVWELFASWNFRKIFQIIFTVLSALIASQFILRFPADLIVFLIAGAVFLLVSLRRPEIIILLIIVILASIMFENALPLIPIPGGSFHFTDVFLLFFLFMIPFKLLTDRRFRLQRTPLDFPLLLFFLAALISAGLTIFSHPGDYTKVIRGFRPVTYYLLFFVVTNFIREKKQIRFLLNSLFIIAAVVSGLMIIQAAGGGAINLMPGQVETISLFGQVADASRITPPGCKLIFVMTIPAFCALVFAKKLLWKSGYLYLLSFIVSGLLLSYTRTFWISSLFSLFVFTLIVAKEEKKRVFASVLLTILLIGFFVSPIGFVSGKAKAFYDSMSDRFGSLFDFIMTMESSSLDWRKIENVYGRRSILQHPLLGIGLGHPYRPRVSWMDSYKKGEEWDSMSYIHNGYFWVLVVFGMSGFLPLLWFFIRFIVDGFSAWRKIKDPFERSAVIGSTLSVLGIAICNLTIPMLMNWASIVVTVTIIGLAETIIQRNEEELSESSRSKIGMNSP